MASEINIPFEKSPLWKDLQNTVGKAKKVARFKTEVTIHTKDKDFKGLKITELQENCDYVKNICGSMHVNIFMGFGDYAYDLYPYRDMLEVTVKKIPLNQETSYDAGAETSTVRYRGVLDTKKGNPTITADSIGGMSREKLNTAQVLDVNLELVDRNIEVLRVATVTGNAYNQVTPKQLISGLLTGESNKISIDGAQAIEGFDIVEPDNSDPINTILIPPGTKIANIPTLLQEKSKGVYSAGIGTHYQRYNGKPSWFVYPLYKTDRFDEDVERAVIFAVPENKMPALDQTYCKEGKVLYIVATGKQKYRDDSQINDLNHGGGFRMPDATGIITKPANVSDGRMTFDRARLNTEVAIRERADGVIFAPVVAPSSNPFKLFSQLAARQTSQVSVSWENSDSDLIYPGMPCKYVFMEGKEYRELRGVILGKLTVHKLSGPAGTASMFTTATTLAIAMEYYKEESRAE